MRSDTSKRFRLRSPPRPFAHRGGEDDFKKPFIGIVLPISRLFPAMSTWIRLPVSFLTPCAPPVVCPLFSTIGVDDGMWARRHAFFVALPGINRR